MKRRILSVLLAVGMMLTLLPGMAFAAEDTAGPSAKPTIDADNDLYQVVVMCQENGAHYWSYTNDNNWATTPDQFSVGEPRENDLDNGTAENYPYICPVTPAYSLDECLENVNRDHQGHHLVTTEETIPVAYYFWNETDGWVLLRDKQPDVNVTFNQNNAKREGTLTVHVSCASDPGPVNPGPVDPGPVNPGPDDSDKPTTKPTVTEPDLYQVEVVCREKGENPTHWWSSPNQTTWEWVDEFAVGEIEANTVYQADTYPWRCPVTPKESLETYLGRINDKVGQEHRLVTTELPVAYYYYNSETSEWEFVKDTDANPNCTVSTDGKDTWFLSIEVTCAEQTGPVWLTSMNIMGYDLFTKSPDKLPDTADGKYLVLAQSGVQGDTDVYALYLNPAAGSSGDGVLQGGSCAVKLAMEDGQLVGYTADSNEKIALEKLLMTVEAVEEGFTISNGGLYMGFPNKIAEATPATISVNSRSSVSGAYQLTGGGRYVSLYVKGMNAAKPEWKTNFWGPRGDPGQSGDNGSSYIYFLHTHVEDGKTVAAFDSEGNELQDVGGYFIIPAGGYIKVEDEVTFTVPNFVQNVELHKNYASNLVMNADGGFGVMGCTITMQDGTTTTSITRSGSAGSGVTFARTADNRLYFGGEGAMTDYSSHNTDVPVWLDGMGDRTLKSVFIGEGVTSVGSNAFKFTALSSVTLSEGLEMIGDGAFESCCIRSIEIPGTVTDIGVNAFKGCLNLRSIELPESVISIGSNAFANCTRLRSVTFAGSLGSIPNGAFQAMSGYGQLNLVFQADAPASAYSDFEGMLPFLHQNGAIVYTQDAPSASLLASGGTDAYFAVLGGVSLSGIELSSGVLPGLPAKDGKAFTGWQVGDTMAALPAGSAVSGQPAGTAFTARWGGDYTVACTVTIDGVGYTVAQGQTMGNQMPADPTREGMRFTGWVDASGAPFTADTPIAGNTVVTSTWVEIPAYTVTFDPNGGVLAGRGSITLYEGEQLTLFQIPDITRVGFTFDGWFNADGSRFLGAIVTNDMTITARWTEQGSEPDVPEGPNTPIGGGSTVIIPPAPVESGSPVEPSEPPEDINEPDTPLGELPFIDVDKEAWYADSVVYVCAKGLMKGISDMEFAPKATLTRGMMAQVMHNMAENPKTDVSSMFADLNGKYYTEAVAWGVANGVLKGYSETTFGGEDDLTREQMAVMLYRYAEAQGLGKDVDMTVLDGFTDSAQVSGWAKEAVAWAVENGLLKGRGNNNLDPRTNITRSEVAAVLERYSKLFLS